MRRSEVFNDLMRETRKRAYSPFKYVKTYFVGEPGKDTGGLTRELWCLFARHLQQSLCEGKENCRVVRHDAAKLQVIIYIWVVLHNLSLTYRRVFTEEWECSWEYQLFRVALATHFLHHRHFLIYVVLMCVQYWLAGMKFQTLKWKTSYKRYI